MLAQKDEFLIDLDVVRKYDISILLNIFAGQKMEEFREYYRIEGVICIKNFDKDTFCSSKTAVDTRTIMPILFVYCPECLRIIILESVPDFGCSVLGTIVNDKDFE